MQKSKVVTKKRQVLNTTKRFKVAAWVEANWQRIITNKLSQEAAATHCSKELGFTVVVAALTYVIKALGKTWPNKNGHDKQMKQVRRHLDAINRILSTMEK